MAETLHGTSTRTARSAGRVAAALTRSTRRRKRSPSCRATCCRCRTSCRTSRRAAPSGKSSCNDIVSKALPADSLHLQATLSNGKRADCLIHLPNPPGPIVIDSEVPAGGLRGAAQRRDRLEANRPGAARPARRAQAHQGHRRALHHRRRNRRWRADVPALRGGLCRAARQFPRGRARGLRARVWIVSPTTCMATLNTMRAILKDARMREQAGAIRKSRNAPESWKRTSGRRAMTSRACSRPARGRANGPNGWTISTSRNCRPTCRRRRGRAPAKAVHVRQFRTKIRLRGRCAALHRFD
jgi:DNA recombination protein RmuC